MSFDQLIPALIVAAVAAALFSTVRLVLAWMGTRNATATPGAILMAVAEAMHWLLLVVFSLVIGASLMVTTPQFEHGVHVLIVTLTLVTMGRICTGVPGKLAMLRIAERGSDPRMITLYRVGSFLLGLLIWTAVVLVVLDTAGADITALVASAGVGGVAVALASQNILSDILASCAIVLDRPFEIGDRLRFDEVEGTVKSIGVKTTRLMTLQGEVLVCPNATLLDKMLRNMGGEVEARSGQVRVPLPWHTPPAVLDELMRDALAIVVADTTMVQSQLGAPTDACLWLEVEFSTRSKLLESYDKARSQVLLALLRLCAQYAAKLGRMAPWPETVATTSPARPTFAGPRG